MPTILDQYGKPFTSCPASAARAILAHVEPLAVTQPRPGFDAMIAVERLRVSCGAPPRTITFRRSVPWEPAATPPDK